MNKLEESAIVTANITNGIVTEKMNISKLGNYATQF